MRWSRSTTGRVHCAQSQSSRLSGVSIATAATGHSSRESEQKDDDAPQGGVVKATLGGGSQMIVAVSGGGSLTRPTYRENSTVSRNFRVKGFFGL